ncbi:kinase-like domain-containing protein [Aspergillus novoparasiticus]|uniref:non-specific serine/threonine protein kinase n=1 Tax=Aspergillus novoparasiticus TaxID=986946 RepID=A0A5N6F7D2_9EURO|nr:kinase-like domain-containing protein [Aspergillus novoparasiticus]
MNSIRASLTKSRSWLSRIFASPASLTAIERRDPRLVREEPDLYQAGGFHRVSLGDTFDCGKYTVLRKLGYGQYSTVWLAKDSKRQRYVTLKLLRADCYGGPHDIYEREILTKITDLSGTSKHEGIHYILPLLDQFKHTGPNGDHVCFVFDVLGHHLDFQCAKYEDGRLPVSAVKVIARQLLLALDFLHRKCGVIHTGMGIFSNTLVLYFLTRWIIPIDLKPTNILLELENPDRVISRYLEEVPPRMDTQGNAEVPLREVITTPLISEMDAPHIRIIDFGVASWRDNHLSEQIQSPALRAPEVTIGAPWDTGVDIWSLGCLVNHELVQGIVPFSGEASERGTWTAEDDRLARTIEILGPFPLEFRKKGSRTPDLFDEKGGLLRIPNMKSTSLERLINGTTKPFLKPDDMPDAEVPRQSCFSMNGSGYDAIEWLQGEKN